MSCRKSKKRWLIFGPTGMNRLKVCKVHWVGCVKSSGRRSEAWTWDCWSPGPGPPSCSRRGARGEAASPPTLIFLNVFFFFLFLYLFRVSRAAGGGAEHRAVDLLPAAHAARELKQGEHELNLSQLRLYLFSTNFQTLRSWWLKNK